jgi:hypothetical protein
MNENEIRCPHCNEVLEIDSKVCATVMARKSLEKRDVSSEAMRKVVSARWDKYRKKQARQKKKK